MFFSGPVVLVLALALAVRCAAGGGLSVGRALLVFLSAVFAAAAVVTMLDQEGNTRLTPERFELPLRRLGMLVGYVIAIVAAGELLWRVLRSERADLLPPLVLAILGGMLLVDPNWGAAVGCAGLAAVVAFRTFTVSRTGDRPAPPAPPPPAPGGPAP